MRLPRPTAEDQKKAIEDTVFDKQTVAGDTWYIISKKWFQDWENYVQRADGDAPGPIDNSPLISGDDSLRTGTEENRDYELLSEEAWKLLYQWYQGGPVMPRTAVQLRNRDHVIIEVRPPTVQLVHKELGTKNVTVSKAMTISQLRTLIATKYDLQDALEVWNADGVQVDDMEKQLYEFHVTDGQQIDVTSSRITFGDSRPSDPIVEDPVNTDVPSQSASTYTSSITPYTSSYPSYSSSSSSSSYSSSSSSSYSSYSSYYDSTPKQPSPPGITGLNNLGNTCFMNSSLQCLSNTVPLTEFFLSGAYERDINLENPLGTQGKLVEEFARLVKELWSGRHSAVAPREFKSRLERFASQFTGYQQHDSQELLAFLLDGLHEDLNRVKKKVYASVREGDDIPDTERAKEAWDIHKNRNDSVIVDWFQASLKSTLVCPDCARVSVTFDPFMYLSLPLPMKMERSIPITLVVLDPAKLPTKYLVKVTKTGTIATLKAKLGEMAGVASDCLIVTDVFNSKFFKKFNDSDTIDTFDEERDVLYAYEVVPQPTEGPKLIHCAVYNRKDDNSRSHYSSSSQSTQLFGAPFFVSIPSNVTYRELYSIIRSAYARWLKRDLPQLGESSTEGSESTQDSQSSESEVDSEAQEVQVLSSDNGPSAFTFQSVDSHGYHETPLCDNNGPLDLENRTTIAAHWKSEYLDYLQDTKSSVNHSSMHSVEKGDDGITLDKCLALYTATEKLGPDDPWYCSKCKEHKQATKKFDLWSAPRILVVHLKRFSYRNKYFREKLETLVEYPLRGLDLTQHIIGPTDPAPIYDLFAVSNHYGSLGGGHYTAYALNKSTQKWYKFDDSHVSEVSESQVVSSSAYVLFYRRRDTIDLSSVPPALSQNLPQAMHDSEEEEEDEDEDEESGERVSMTNVSLPRVNSSSVMELD